MRLRAIIALILALLLLAGCGQSTKINVEWIVHSTEPEANSSVAAMSLMLAADHATSTSDAPVTVIETEGMNLGYQASSLDVTWIEVRARLIGGQRTRPFGFDVVSSQASYPWEQLDDATIRIDPIAPGNGVVVVRYEGLETVVPFAIAPVFVLAQYPDPIGIEGRGISFATGQIHADRQGDIYITESGYIAAPLGYVEELKSGFWDESFWGTRDVRGLQFSTPNAAFNIQLGRLYVVKTDDGGYAMFFASAQKGDGKWNLIWRYSPTGIFE